MRFDKDKKKSIIIYLLEKIDQGDSGISKAVSDAFSINQNTVHRYINELAKEGVIHRVKRNQYELINQRYEYHLKRSNGDLLSDMYAYNACLSPHISLLPENVQQIWAYTFSEMVNNVMDHSDAENLIIRIEQNYLKTIAVIEDDGIGIFKKIKDHFCFESLEDAICELFKGKLTTDTKNHSGEGIFFSSKMMDDFYIISGGKIFTINKYDNSVINDIASKERVGTCVFMSLSNFSHKESREVFDLYANVDGGFTKTTIPMKNIFDSYPVSRSQAKRVCNRLEKFQEVIIDFDEVQWMGQGFAHQLFVVFANEHPEIKLTPVGMNEDIEKMYIHVISES
ncbi:MAG: DUF4325 domain-containing protein [Lachnospiraceae bacterium]|nr:DUF4325 domain-containing protein [Lachnospiraceae bacterium]